LSNLHLKGETHDSGSIRYQKKAEYHRAWSYAWECQRCLPQVGRVPHARLRYQIRYRKRGPGRTAREVAEGPAYRKSGGSEIEQKALDYSLEYPDPGQKRVASDGGVRSIWLRRNLQISSLRLKRLEKWSAENRGVLIESQVQALEQAKEEREAHGEIESHHPGFLLGQDNCFHGTLSIVE